MQDTHQFAELTETIATHAALEGHSTDLPLVARLGEIQDRTAALPQVGEPLSDADFYDDDGLPR